MAALKASTFAPLGAPVQATSTGTGNVASITVPSGACAMYVSVETNGARIVFDGSTPGATSLFLATTGAQPAFLLCVPQGGNAFKFASAIAGNSLVTVQFLQ